MSNIQLRNLSGENIFPKTKAELVVVPQGEGSTNLETVLENSLRGDLINKLYTGSGINGIATFSLNVIRTNAQLLAAKSGKTNVSDSNALKAIENVRLFRTDVVVGTDGKPTFTEITIHPETIDNNVLTNVDGEPTFLSVALAKLASRISALESANSLTPEDLQKIQDLLNSINADSLSGIITRLSNVETTRPSTELGVEHWIDSTDTSVAENFAVNTNSVAVRGGTSTNGIVSLVGRSNPYANNRTEAVNVYPKTIPQAIEFNVGSDTKNLGNYINKFITWVELDEYNNPIN